MSQKLTAFAVAILVSNLLLANCVEGAIGEIMSGETKSFSVSYDYDTTLEDSTSSGTAAAAITIGVSSGGGVYTIESTIQNLSVDDSGDGNLSATITGWGFNTNPSIAATSWDIYAMVLNGSNVLEERHIGSSAWVGNGSKKGDPDFNYWTLLFDPQGNASISVDQFADTSGNNYCLYNPAYISDPNLATELFTSARLEATFNTPIVVTYEVPPDADGIYDDGSSPAVRFQQVGGGGSLKLVPTEPPPEDAPPLVPEPTSLAAWLLGSAGLGLILRGRMKKAAA